METAQQLWGHDLPAQQTPMMPVSPAAPASVLRRDVPPSPFIHGESRGLFEPLAAGDARKIAFSNGIVVDTRAGEPALPADLRLVSYGPDRPAYYLVQFGGPIRTEWRESLAQAGAELLAYLPNYAYLVRLAPDRVAQVASLSHVVWTGLYQPAYKVSGQPEMARAGGPQTVVFLLFPGESVAAVEEVIAAQRGRVLESASAGPNPLIRAEIELADIALYARLPQVAWVEPWHPAELFNNRAQWVLQTFENGLRRIWDMGITGQGQILSSLDTGIRTTHDMFRDPGVPIDSCGDYPTHRKIIAYHKTCEDSTVNCTDEIPCHGTHTACTLVGNDSTVGGGSAYDGMAKDARIYHLDGSGPSSGGLCLPVDLYSVFLRPYLGNAGGAARIMSNSWGTSTGGYYDYMAMQADQFTWDHPDFLLFFSVGDAEDIGSPATAKDCYSAGATLNGLSATQLCLSSARGPTHDGRRKPTAVSPGCPLMSASCTGDQAYASMSGTSMASPSAAGTMALAHQYLEEGWYPTGTPTPAHAFTPSAALLKAMAVNGTFNDISGFIVPDNNVGWGRICLDPVLYFPGDARHTVLVDESDGLLTGDYVEYQIWVTDPALPLRISLVWSDYPGTPAGDRVLVNDLDLMVMGDGSTYLGNVFSGGQSATGGTPDSLNVEECVWRTNPATGLWIVRVMARNVPVGPQPFALVVTGLGGEAGVVFLDRGIYGGADTLRIRLEDLDAGPTVSVDVSSTTETTPESAVLSLSLAHVGGVYEGTFPTTLFDVVPGDGQVSVSNGDVITVTYNDASPPHAVTATAHVLVTPPTITSVATLDVGRTSATVGWTTSTPALSKIYYGPTPSLGLATTLDPALVTSHTHAVSGLAASTTYYYDVESRDRCGNTVRADNGGVHYRLTTRDRGDILLVIGDSTFTERDKYVAAFSRTGWTWDEWGDALAENPPVGHRQMGLRSYGAVWWQVGWEQYPCLSDAARDSLAKYLAGGARLSIISHDLAWDFCDPTSPDYSPERCAWLHEELCVAFKSDPTTWTSVRGVSGDPISGGYTSGITYTPFRSGAGGDAIRPALECATCNPVWMRPLPSPMDTCSVRCVSPVPNGDPDSAVWGGTPSRWVTNTFEWSRLNPSVADDTVRADVLHKTLLWLIGRNHPVVMVTAPNGGETLATSPVPISWVETTDGDSVASRKIEYSDDGGQSWNLLTGSAGSSPYSWDISAIPNGDTYRVRVTVVSAVALAPTLPTLTGQDASNANFTIGRPGGDTRGPLVIAGSVFTTPNPVPASGSAVLQATLDDTRTGNSNIVGARWSLGQHPLPPVQGTPMSCDCGSPVSICRDTVYADSLPDGINPGWIQGLDAAGAWGPADSFTIIVNGGRASVAGDIGGSAPAFDLAPNIPNPFNPETTIRFSLERNGQARLAVYDATGRLVRQLVNEELAAGRHEVRWDGRDARGRPVASGIYFSRLEADGKSAVRKTVLMK